MLNVTYGAMVGAARVIGATGSSTPTNGFREGVVSATARTGAGVYTATLSPGADIQECVFRTSPQSGAGNSNVQVAPTSDVLLDITAFVAAVATDINFYLTIQKVRTGS